MKKNTMLIVLLAILVIAVGGIYVLMQGSYSTTTPTTTTSTTSTASTTTTQSSISTTFQPQTFNVNIQNFAFSPSQLTVHLGDTVVWTNRDSTSHTVTSDSGNELGSSSIHTSGTYSHTFNQAGTFGYHCSIHPSMKATVTVG